MGQPVTSDRRSPDPAGQGDGRTSIFRRVLTAQRLARGHASIGNENGRADDGAGQRPTEREAAAFAAAQDEAGAVDASVAPDTAASQAELLDLRQKFVRLQELEQSLATAQGEVAGLESELAAAREAERSALERSRVLDQDLAAALTELTRVPAILDEAKRALTLDRDVEELRVAVSEAHAQCASATSRADEAEAFAASAEARAKAAESRAANADERGAVVQAQLKAAETRATTAEARVVSVDRRAIGAEAAVARLEASQREMERRHAAELTDVRAKNEAPKIESGEVKRLSAEVESLRARVALAEEAVSAALRELGVKPGKGPITAADVMRAVGPLTLHALGEGTPGWAPVAPEDTLAAAVLTLAQRAAEQQRRLDRLGSAPEKSAARR
jgi:hypothetical protein